MREVIMPMEDKDYDLLMEATRQADPTDEGWTEIVRCKDCKRWNKSKMGSERNYCPNVLRYTPEDFFCADGKRKEGE